MFAAMVFITRIACAWTLIILPIALIVGHNVEGTGWVVFGALAAGAVVLIGAISHLYRAHMVAGKLNHRVLTTRQRRQVELPYEAGEAFDLVEAAVRDLPGLEDIDVAPGSYTVQAMVVRPPFNGRPLFRLFRPLTWFSAPRDLVRVTVTAGEDVSLVTMTSGPDGGLWDAWFVVDDACNYENVETLSRSLSRRMTGRRRREQEMHRQTETEKELSEARLGLLSAQVEPHFLYNSLASAQVLVRTDPARADEMLGNLISYLRHSLPKVDEQMSNLGTELERTRAYLDILKVRMGNRLTFWIDVPDEAKAVPMPAMMLQTLAENSIKHGLEPKTGGGTVWIRARLSDGALDVTVADDGRGLSTAGSGTGIGLKNVRERLRLIYGNAAGLSIANNFPTGVSATLVIPMREA
jgi:two-component sensor histidine kinase